VACVRRPHLRMPQSMRANTVMEAIEVAHQPRPRSEPEHVSHAVRLTHKTAPQKVCSVKSSTYTNGALNCSVAITRWVAGRANTRCRYGPKCGSDRAGRALKLRVQRHSVNT